MFYVAGKKMSIIIKENGGFNREVELPNEVATVIKTIGIEPEMTNDEIIDTLKHASIHMVAHGLEVEYKKLINAANEVEEWKSENVIVEY